MITTTTDDDSVRIFYASTSGNARSLAQKLGADLDRTVIDLSEVLEPEKTFANEEEEEEGILKMERKKVLKCAIFVVSTTTGGEIASECKHFMKWCEEQAYDERAGWVVFEGAQILRLWRGRFAIRGEL